MTLNELLANTRSILPLTILMAWALVLLLVDLFIPANRKGWIAVLSVVGLLIALALTLIPLVTTDPQPLSAFNGMLSTDPFSKFLIALFLVSGIISIALAYDYLKRMHIERGEFYVLLLLSIGGMMLMAQAADLIVIFLALEWFSIPLYVLAGFARPKTESEESGLKYFLLGSYATGFIVYGTALIFGATGYTSLQGIVNAIRAETATTALLTIGAALVLVGLGFKVSAVPFHMWTPDVYHGAPSPVSGYMAVAAKMAGFAALLRIFIVAFPSITASLTPVIWVLAALTMILGNIVAIAQSNIKRLLAYSSIAHAGYLLMALVTFGQARLAPDAVASALFYLVAYAFATFGAWGVVIALEKSSRQEAGVDSGGTQNLGLQIQDYAGLGRKYPALAAAMTVFMLSFTGVPPTLGFVGKFYLFRTALEGGYLGLALIGVLTSLVSAYYYLRVVVVMYMNDGEPQARSEPWLNLAVFASALVVVLLSIFASPLFNWAAKALLANL